MLENIIFLAPAIVACVLLAGILSYFGNHILTRGIIFIDIAIAQIAALGTMIGLLLGFAEESFVVQLISYGFTLVVISFFALIRSKKMEITQEVIIGIIYCVALGLALLFAEMVPGGSNYITKTITGNILWVTWKQVLYTLIVVVAVGLIHIYWGKKFISISENIRDKNFKENSQLLELVFFVTFGFVIVKAVQIQGIFLVFILLIAPAAISRLFTDNWRNRFVWSWIIGILGSTLGVIISHKYNVSNGPAIVCLLSFVVFVAAFYKAFKRVIAKRTISA
ncbi:MAG TPA: metal ABC transporter permease [Tenuifilaceae bacterium]|nr:metal ABC transporter permease [Tenuifilaceae bacterium]HPQ35705.1 metal ABC transporter permease [Tenuifilaceae bacterium]